MLIEGMSKFQEEVSFIFHSFSKANVSGVNLNKNGMDEERDYAFPNEITLAVDERYKKNIVYADDSHQNS